MIGKVRIPASLLNEIKKSCRKSFSQKRLVATLWECIERKYKRIYVLHTYIPSLIQFKNFLLRLSLMEWKDNQVISRLNRNCWHN